MMRNNTHPIEIQQGDLVWIPAHTTGTQEGVAGIPSACIEFSNPFVGLCVDTTPSPTNPRSLQVLIATAAGANPYLFRARDIYKMGETL